MLLRGADSCFLLQRLQETTNSSPRSRQGYHDQDGGGDLKHRARWDLDLPVNREKFVFVGGGADDAMTPVGEEFKDIIPIHEQAELIINQQGQKVCILNAMQMHVQTDF